MERKEEEKGFGTAHGLGQHLRRQLFASFARKQTQNVYAQAEKILATVLVVYLEFYYVDMGYIGALI